ncbi:MAG: hypothetical protein EU543_00765, partial [Promethearchaeota archaeon]
MSMREYNTELQKFIDKIVKVYIDNERFFVGTLKGVSEEANLIVNSAKNEKNKVFPQILINNSYYQYVTVEEEPF